MRQHKDQLSLFDSVEPIETPKPRVLSEMHAMYGVTEGKRCAECRMLSRRERGNKRFSKCLLANPDGGPSTDWRSKWEACGKWETEAMRA